jgi:sterol desaturase/sphingolipid hydroxylase (fatty acid hydroxylase superfamily)
MSQSSSVPVVGAQTTMPVAGRMPPALAALLLAGSAVCIVLLLSWGWISGGLANNCSSWLGSVLGEHGCIAGMNKLLTYSWVLALLPVMLLIERRIPADPDQPAFSPGMMVDCLWFITFPLLGVWLPSLFEHFLNTSLGAVLAGFRLKALVVLPLPTQLLLVIVVADFLAWFGHYVRHKVPLLWEFHKIHHSQVQLNYFSTRRLHPLDLMANSLVRFLPWTLLGLTVALPGFLIWSTFLRLYEMFVHSNIRTSLGPLRYFMVTPQTHRIHHSLRPQHIDKNFGDFFSVWDFIFGTQSMDFHVYPQLGVSDENCPRGVATSLGGAIRTLSQELVYPLRVLWGKAALVNGRPHKNRSGI